LPLISKLARAATGAVALVNRNQRKVPTVAIYIAGALWAGWLFWLGLTGGLGPEPINALERAYGDVALKLLVLTLMITPLRRFAGLNLLRFRRALGLTAFFFIVAHFCVWALLDVHSLTRVWADIVKRPYVTVGMTAFFLLLPLALTSNDRSIRKLGGALWRRVHWLTYPASVLVIVHYIWLTKGFPYQALVYGALIGGLFAARIRVKRRKAI